MSFEFAKLRYVSFENDLIEDFYKPAIKNSVLYKRMAGYFSSSFIDELYDEIKFAKNKNDFKMEIICSPELSEQDKDSIKKGYEHKSIIEKNISNVLENSLETPEKLNELTKLIIDGVIDFKFAVTSQGNGIFHAKEGLFYTEDGERIGFTGSNNETVSALKYNFETTNIFKEDNSNQVLEHMENTFNKLWNNQNENVFVIGISEVLLDNINELYKKTIQDRRAKKPIKISEKFSLYDYQNEAVRRWTENNYKGLLEMATGTGKTITALACQEKLRDTKDVLATFIVVPQLDLLSQWNEEIIDLNFKTVCCSSKHKDWESHLKILLRNEKSLKDVIIITTVQTFISNKMQMIISNYLNNEAFLIADEVHGFGAEKTRGYFDVIKERFNYLLGVSATPFRKSEEETTEVFELFDEIIFSYTLEDAINNGYLNKYYYHPIIVPFSDTELHEYRLGIQKSSDKNHYIPLDVVENITSTIINSSTGKIQVLIDLIKETGIENPKIIYASPGNFNDSKVSYDEKHIDYVTRRIGTLGCNARKVNGLVPIQERDDILNQFREKKLDTLVAVKVLDQGVNLKSVTHAFILSSTDSKTEFIQRRGRILRIEEGKPASKIYDIVMLPHDIKDYFNTPTFEDAYVVDRELRRMKEYNIAAVNSKDNDRTIEQIHEFYEEVLKEYEERKKIY